jgi:hypothetical protein
VVLEHSGDPGEPDRRSMAFGLAQSVEQFSVCWAWSSFPICPAAACPS